MDLIDKKVLITGGAGAIGYNLVKALIRRCKEIVIVDDLSSGHNGNLPKEKSVRFIKSTILDESVLKHVFSKGVDVVFHLAANFANQNSVEYPRKDLLVNGMGTLKLLQYANKHSVKRFVYTSSSCVYGNKSGILSEDCKDYSLDTPYAITKLLGERYVTFFHEYCGLESVILRYFNTYGPGEYPGRYRNVIPNFIGLAMNNKPLVITGTGNETRDFNYVEDSVAGTLLAAESDKAVGQTFNFGSGKETKIIELARKINEITGNKADVIFNEKRKWDSVVRRCASIEKAKSVLGYKPRVNIDEGLKKTYDWLKRVLR